VVYAAQLFSKGARPTAAVVDIGGTEKVRPVIVDDSWVAQSSFMQFETVKPEGYTRPTGRGNTMKLSAIALACVITLSSTFAFAHGHRRHRHHVSHYGNPNGSPGGPTSLSGTGSSSFGGSEPGNNGRN
jgi:hypothetical protein